MNPVDMHTLVSDLIQPALVLTEAAPQDANPAISYATASTGQLTNEANASNTVQLPVVGWGSFAPVEAVIAHEVTSVDHSLQDDIPTPEQMWGLGGIANAPEDFTFIATPPGKILHSVAAQLNVCCPSLMTASKTLPVALQK